MGNEINERPSFEQITLELGRINSKDKKRKDIRRILGFLIVVAAISILISLMVLPVFQIKGHSMTPNVKTGDIVVGFKLAKIDKGDVIAFNHNNSVLIKRVIAVEGDVVDIDNDGNVYVNDELIEEPYVSNKSYGKDVTVKFPYQVPVDSLFLLGDYREDSIDSRSKSIGAVSKDLVIGKIILRVWPFKDITGKI